MKNVSKTLYIPLYGKALVSRKGMIQNDPDAEAIWAAEGFPLRGKASSKWLAYYMAMRSVVFDRWASEQMCLHPKAVVLHIGCGMDSRCKRISDEAFLGKWYDIDLPDVIEERKRYFQQDDTYRMLNGDARETVWLDALPTAENAIVILEGMTMYLKPEELTGLLKALGSRFTQLAVLLDCYTSMGAKASKYKNPINTVGVTQVYGLDDPLQLAAQSDMHFVKEHPMAPDDLILALKGGERFLFRKLFAGGFAKKLYRLYELKKG